MKTKTTKFIPGELYSDIQNADSKSAVILRFVKTEKDIHYFQYVSGPKDYISLGGFIRFLSGCMFFPFTEKK